jgi:hypothetical protein
MFGSQIAEYIDATFGGPDRLRKDILYDFFKSAFDGPPPLQRLQGYLAHKKTPTSLGPP